MGSDFSRKIVFAAVFMIVLIMIGFAANCEWLMITATVCMPAVVGIGGFICKAKLKSDSGRGKYHTDNKPIKGRKKSHIIILANNDEIIDYEISKF